MDEDNRHVFCDAHVAKPRHPKRSEGALGQQFLVKPFIPQAWASVHAQHCLHGETPQNARQSPAEVALGTREFGDASSNLRSLTDPRNLKSVTWRPRGGRNNPDIAPPRVAEPGLGYSLEGLPHPPPWLTPGRVRLTEPGAPSSPFPSPQWNNLPFGASPRY